MVMEDGSTQGHPQGERACAKLTLCPPALSANYDRESESEISPRCSKIVKGHLPKVPSYNGSDLIFRLTFSPDADHFFYSGA
jgi:hypothetical protein